MSQQTTIRKLAELVNTPVEKLLEQLAEAGMQFSDPDQVVTSAEKLKLLGFLKRAHGKGEAQVEEIAAPKKITLARRKVQELTVGGGRSKTTVNVEVRQKRTYKTAEPASDNAAAPVVPVDAEHAEVLRKLEESRQRNLAEQQRLAEEDRVRAEENERKRREEEVQRQAEEEARKADEERQKDSTARGDATEAARPARGTPAHRPAPDRGADDGRGHKHKTRGSHVMVAGIEDDDSAASRFAGQLHLSAADRARRTSARTTGKAKPQRRSEMRGGGGNAGAGGFERPTAPVVREVAIGDSTTVADLAQKLALKGGDVVKALFKMGVMAT
ncbi:MAG: translation initiation factor IF-2 associated domain-containing protein, partial [Xanthomonadaceae bacterium]|nr:translation initiation factor IF-2 associated domain-containing protein [Xanthomonadaceae bacterium]